MKRELRNLKNELLPNRFTNIRACTHTDTQKNACICTRQLQHIHRFNKLQRQRNKKNVLISSSVCFFIFKFKLDLQGHAPHLKISSIVTWWLLFLTWYCRLFVRLSFWELFLEPYVGNLLTAIPFNLFS